jgi:hypothetical protein
MNNDNINILNNYGGISQNSLVDMLDNEQFMEEDEPVIFQLSNYYGNDQLIDIIKEKQHLFKIFSLNCQSLFAKMDQLKAYLEILGENNCFFDVICLQETWMEDNMDKSMFNLEGYNMISKGRDVSSHGGLAIYLRNCYEYEELCPLSVRNCEWEYQFLRVKIESSNTDIIIGNIYRLPRETNNDYESFFHEFADVIQTFDSMKNMVILGDFNIDLLKVHEKSKVGDFVDLILSSGLIPKITLPTRLSNNCATLIDNALCKLTRDFAKTTAGILTCNISDHQPYFVSLDYLGTKMKSPKMIKIRKYDIQAVDIVQ